MDGWRDGRMESLNKPNKKLLIYEKDIHFNQIMNRNLKLSILDCSIFDAKNVKHEFGTPGKK